MRILIISLCFMSSAAWAGKIKPLDVKLGLWETTMNTTTAGQIPIPPEFLAKMTPEQRARFEAKMQANSAPKTHTHTHRSCMTQEKVDKGEYGQERPNCTRTVISSTSRKAIVHVVCANEGVKSEWDVQVTAKNSENIKGTVHIKESGGGRVAKADDTFTSKWLGSSCGKVK